MWRVKRRATTSLRYAISRRARSLLSIIRHLANAPRQPGPVAALGPAQCGSKNRLGPQSAANWANMRRQGDLYHGLPHEIVATPHGPEGARHHVGAAVPGSHASAAARR